MTTAEQAAGKHTGQAVQRSRPIGGEAFEVTLHEGSRVVAKRGSGPNAALAEAAGLGWLAESGDIPLPLVHGVDDEWLVIEYVAAGSPSVEAATGFGHSLAELHLRGAPGFGSPPDAGTTDAWIGLAPMRNQPEPDWPTFYAEHRVLPYVRMAADNGLYDQQQVAVFERACARLAEHAGEPEPPARLHGDAWSGNVRWAADGRAWLIDPAAHGGHRETDLAMLRLFGLPQLERVLDAYQEAAQGAGAPLQQGWPDRVGMHQLHPLLVHAALFGGGYAAQALAAARTLG